MFYDDTSSTSNKFIAWLTQPPTPKEVQTLLEKDAQLWELLLWTSGGPLNLKKCFSQTIVWIFNDKGIPSTKPAEEIPPITLSSSKDNKPTKIEHKSTNTGL